MTPSPSGGRDPVFDFVPNVQKLNCVFFSDCSPDGMRATHVLLPLPSPEASLQKWMVPAVKAHSSCSNESQPPGISSCLLSFCVVRTHIFQWLGPANSKPLRIIHSDLGKFLTRFLVLDKLGNSLNPHDTA